MGLFSYCNIFFIFKIAWNRSPRKKLISVTKTIFNFFYSLKENVSVTLLIYFPVSLSCLGNFCVGSIPWQWKRLVEIVIYYFFNQCSGYNLVCLARFYAIYFLLFISLLWRPNVFVMFVIWNSRNLVNCNVWSRQTYWLCKVT